MTRAAPLSEPPARLRRERSRLESEFAEPITLDGLTGSWFIFQRAHGHRHSIDDVLTAHYALEVSPRVSTHLDLGAGIGTVGLLVLSKLDESSTLTAVEAQNASHRLLVANVSANALSDRVRALHGDLRELSLGESFPLITGSPPYFPLGSGIVPQDSQKAHARFELRGDVSDYALAAARHLAADGWFVFCFPSVQTERALGAVAAAGLSVARRRDVIPREGRAALFSLFACRRSASALGCVVDAPFVVRTETGELTSATSAVRRDFGFQR
ncbi:MAG TPA: methyltransferase [Polyangiaceae bacterium]|nr:methyltransferase [Polyangiaceae bacterium]